MIIAMMVIVFYFRDILPWYRLLLNLGMFQIVKSKNPCPGEKLFSEIV